MTRWKTGMTRGALAGLLAWVVGMGSAGSSARADFISFDADGAGGAATPLTISQFNYSAGNALAANALPLTVGSQFDLLFQATLGSVTLSTGTQVTPGGLNSTYEITVVARIAERVSSITTGPTSATFQLQAVQSVTSFVEIYFDPLRDANPLTGTGFDNGTLIFFARPDGTLPNSGNFTFSETTPGTPDILPFDQNGTNNYPGVNTIVGSGGATIRGSQIFQDNAFFLTPGIAQLISNSVNSTPFVGVDPSAMFDLIPGTTGPNRAVNRGTLNGGTAAQGGGTDFQFQAQINQSFTVPEPASLVLTGLGFVGLLGARRARTRKPAA